MQPKIQLKTVDEFTLHGCLSPDPRLNNCILNYKGGNDVMQGRPSFDAVMSRHWN